MNAAPSAKVELPLSGDQRWKRVKVFPRLPSKYQPAPSNPDGVATLPTNQKSAAPTADFKRAQSLAVRFPSLAFVTIGSCCELITFWSTAARNRYLSPLRSMRTESGSSNDGIQRKR